MVFMARMVIFCHTRCNRVWDAGSLDLDPAEFLPHFIPTMQDEAAQLMDDILTPIPIEIKLNK
jgi:hypothetical protein